MQHFRTNMKYYLIALFAPALMFFGWNLNEERNHAPTTLRTQIQLSDDDLKPTMTQEKVEAYVTNIFQAYHFRKFRLNDSLSTLMFDNYLSSIDRQKYYFLESDIKSFEKYRNQLDDYLNSGRLDAAYDIYNVFRKRYRERSVFLDALLKDPKFDYSVDENIGVERAKGPYAKDAAELDDLWRKLIKSEMLDLKIANKADTAALKIVRERYKSRERNLGRIRSEQVFQTYMNAFCESLDPHTRYFSPTESDRFKQDMYKSLEGIGASLQEDGNYIKIAQIISGGPAFRDKRLKVGDRIVGVAQGDNGPVEDIIGWYVDDAVKKIKGSKGTIVRLQVLSADAAPNSPPKEIKLVRDKVNLQESRTKQEIVTINANKRDYKFGLITIPSFYRNFDDANKRSKDFASTTRDVQFALDTLKAANVDGIIIDLRNNGGGSLTEAISLTGLFISKGPVVQVRETAGGSEVYTDPDPSVYYEGPLAVMTNRMSASASEIFAGAIQDYKRGIILGEQTYGKGTVQTMVDLNQVLSQEKEKLGQVNITVQKFYRISGNSTQRKGVMPDVSFPSAWTAEKYGEESEPTALPWDQIATTRFDVTKFVTEKQIDKLRDKYQQRQKSDADLKLYAEEMDRIKKEKEITSVSLQETKRRKQREEDDKRRKTLEKLMEVADDIDEDVAEVPAKPAPKKKRKDIYLIETERLLADYILMFKGSSIAAK
jgi:carboxyl-terminal processing protease